MPVAPGDRKRKPLPPPPPPEDICAGCQRPFRRGTLRNVDTGVGYDLDRWQLMCRECAESRGLA